MYSFQLHGVFLNGYVIQGLSLRYHKETSGYINMEVYAGGLKIDKADNVLFRPEALTDLAKIADLLLRTVEGAEDGLTLANLEAKLEPLLAGNLVENTDEEDL